MIAMFAIAALLSSDPLERNEAADWECAEGFIERNYTQRVEAADLAFRIADECERPYRPPTGTTQADRALDDIRRATHHYQMLTFRREIQSRIEAERRRDAIQLD